MVNLYRLPNNFNYVSDYAYWNYDTNLSGYWMQNPVIFKYNGDYNIFSIANFIYGGSNRTTYAYIYPFTNNLNIVNKYKYYPTNHDAYSDGIENYINYIYSISIQNDPDYEIIKLNTPKDLTLWICENFSIHSNTPIYKNDSIISYTNKNYEEADPYLAQSEYSFLSSHSGLTGVISSAPVIFKYNGKYNIFIANQTMYYDSPRQAHEFAYPLTDELQIVNYQRYYAANSSCTAVEYINYIYGITLQNDPNYEIISLESAYDFIPWCLNNMIHYNNDPVYKDVTKINYTDDSYEIIDQVLSEQQAKDHAYTNLLNTYGTFYKANEVQVSEYYKKQMSS